MRPGRIALVVIGSVLALIGVVLLVAGSVLAWAMVTQRDADGYFASETHRFETETAVLTSDLDWDTRPAAWLLRRNLATLRVRVAQADEAGSVFVGVGPASDVDAYLAGVAHDEVTDLDFDPFRPRYRRVPGEQALAPPLDRDFWVAQASGAGTQTLEWEVESGRWAVVLARADAAPGVAADVSLGLKATFLGWLVVGLLIGGLVVGAGGVALIVLGAVGAAGAGAPPGAEGPGAPAGAAVGTRAVHAPGEMPVRVEARLDEPLSRWLWLVKWFLAIPHAILLFFLWIGFVVVTIVAGFAILFTGRYPRSLFDYTTGVLRWTWRVTYYATSAIGTDRYPPFSLAPSDHPASLDIAYPEQLSRGLVLVKWWLLALPHYLVVSVFTSGWWMPGPGLEAAGGVGLIGLLVVFAGVALLFTGRYPRGIFSFLMGMNRWMYRVIAYAALMTDRYPPFRLDAGGNEPPPAAASEPRG